MATFIRGDVVVVPFPFSDLSSSKRRPALVLAELPGNDLILCQITSQFVKDALAIALADTDFVSGSLKADSFIRPQQTFHSRPNYSCLRDRSNYVAKTTGSI